MTLYSVGTWNMNEQAYMPQSGVEKSFNLTFSELRRVVKRLKELGYSAHRRGNCHTDHDDNDWCILIERTDGKPETEIMEDWKR